MTHACTNPNCKTQLEAYQLAAADLERRFEKFRSEVFVRRQVLSNAIHELQDKTSRLLSAERSISLLSQALSEWQRLADEQPLMTLDDALAELKGITDPLDVTHLTELPPVAA